MWAHLLHSVRTGENAFRAGHGVDVWEYRARHPEEAAIFDAAMTGFSRRVNAAVAAAHDFGRYGVIVDVGGDHGALLAGILADYPGVRATEILRACRRAARAGTALLVIERQFALPATKLSDLNMLVSPGGRERTVEEYAGLLAAADYELVGETPTAADVSVIEARAL